MAKFHTRPYYKCTRSAFCFSRWMSWGVEPVSDRTPYLHIHGRSLLFPTHWSKRGDFVNIDPKRKKEKKFRHRSALIMGLIQCLVYPYLFSSSSEVRGASDFEYLRLGEMQLRPLTMLRHPRYTLLVIFTLGATFFLLPYPSDSDSSLSSRLDRAERIYQDFLPHRQELIKKFGPNPQDVESFVFLFFCFSSPDWLNLH